MCTFEVIFTSFTCQNEGHIVIMLIFSKSLYYIIMIYSIWILLGRKSIPVHLPQDPPQSIPVSSKFWSLSKQCHAKKLFWNSMAQKNNVEFRIDLKKIRMISYFTFCIVSILNLPTQVPHVFGHLLRSFERFP